MMKFISIFILLLLLNQVSYSQDFITKWTFDEPTTEIQFSTLTTGTVNYTWTTSPSGNSGSGQFSERYTDSVVLRGLNIEVGDTITLNLAPENLKRFFFQGWLRDDLYNFNLIEVSQWGSVVWSSMESMFDKCRNLSINALDKPNISNVTNMSRMFYVATNFNYDIGDWDVSGVKRMRGMFAGSTNFNQDIGGWDVSDVIEMERMFNGATNFNQDIGGWDVSNVTEMDGMFYRADSFNQDISEWDVSNVTDMSWMFFLAKNFNQDIGGWDVSNVTNMNSMFANADSFNQDIGGWEVSNVVDMDWMFGATSNFDQDISEWDVSNVIEMVGMFSNAESFNQDLQEWDVSNVIDMWIMFNKAKKFNKDLGDWELHPEVEIGNMFDSSGMDCDHYSATLIGWQKNNPSVSNAELGAAGLEYGTSATEARDSLINVQGWTIEGDVKSSMPCDELVSSNSPQVNAQSQLLIYPNPAQDQIHLLVNNLPYTILNTQGKAVQKGRVEAQRIPVESLPAGIYFLQVRDDHKVYQAKFVKD